MPAPIPRSRKITTASLCRPDRATPRAAAAVGFKTVTAAPSCSSRAGQWDRFRAQRGTRAQARGRIATTHEQHPDGPGRGETQVESQPGYLSAELGQSCGGVDLPRTASVCQEASLAVGDPDLGQPGQHPYDSHRLRPGVERQQRTRPTVDRRGVPAGGDHDVAQQQVADDRGHCRPGQPAASDQLGLGQRTVVTKETDNPCRVEVARRRRTSRGRYRRAAFRDGSAHTPIVVVSTIIW